MGLSTYFTEVRLQEISSCGAGWKVPDTWRRWSRRRNPLDRFVLPQKGWRAHQMPRYGSRRCFPPGSSRYQGELCGPRSFLEEQVRLNWAGGSSHVKLLHGTTRDVPGCTILLPFLLHAPMLQYRYSCAGAGGAPLAASFSSPEECESDKIVTTSTLPFRVRDPPSQLHRDVANSRGAHYRFAQLNS